MLDVYSAKRGVAPHYKLTLDQIYGLSLDAMTDYEIKQIIGGIDETLRDDEDYLDELMAEREMLFSQRDELQAELDDIARKRDALLIQAEELDAQGRALEASGKEVVNAANDILPAIKDIEQISDEYRKAQDFLRDYLRGRK